LHGIRLEVTMAIERRPDGTTRGGNEPPDEVQDTPEQNAGYDAAARGEHVADPVDPEPVDPARDAPPDRHAADRGKRALTDMPERPAGQGTGG
jgi:hypothetical protein